LIEIKDRPDRAFRRAHTSGRRDAYGHDVIDGLAVLTQGKLETFAAADRIAAKFVADFDEARRAAFDDRTMGQVVERA